VSIGRVARLVAVPSSGCGASQPALATPNLERHHIDEHVRELRVLVDSRADLVKRRTMVINQVKAHAHVWLDHAPGDLTRATGLAS
jgi:hypothetical protein